MRKIPKRTLTKCMSDLDLLGDSINLCGVYKLDFDARKNSTRFRLSY